MATNKEILDAAAKNAACIVKLETVLQEISDIEDVRFTCGCGYDPKVDALAKGALKGT